MTTQATHTPGPWYVEDMGMGVIEICTVPGADDDFIAIAEVIHEAGEWTEEHTANARLIATAPELLEALQSWVEIAKGGTTSTKYSAALDVARAAIAKATGIQL